MLTVGLAVLDTEPAVMLRVAVPAAPEFARMPPLVTVPIALLLVIDLIRIGTGPAKLIASAVIRAPDEATVVKNDIEPRLSNVEKKVAGTDFKSRELSEQDRRLKDDINRRLDRVINRDDDDK